MTSVGEPGISPLLDTFIVTLLAMEFNSSDFMQTQRRIL